MNKNLFEALMAETERCRRWYGEADLFVAVAAWAEELERRVRRLEAVPDVIDCQPIRPMRSV